MSLMCACLACAWCVPDVFLVCSWCVPGVCLVCAWCPHLPPPPCPHNHTHTTATCWCCRGCHRCGGVPKHPTRHAAAAGAAGAATPTAAAAGTHHMCCRHADGRCKARCCRTSRHARPLLPLLPVLILATANGEQPKKNRRFFWQQCFGTGGNRFLLSNIKMARNLKARKFARKM